MSNISEVLDKYVWNHRIATTSASLTASRTRSCKHGSQISTQYLATSAVALRLNASNSEKSRDFSNLPLTVLCSLRIRIYHPRDNRICHPVSYALKHPLSPFPFTRLVHPLLNLLITYTRNEVLVSVYKTELLKTVPEVRFWFRVNGGLTE